MSYVETGKEEGVEVLIGSNVETLESEFGEGYFIQSTVMKSNNSMRINQEEIFGPVVSVTAFQDEAEALEIANDTEFGFGG